MRLFIAIEFSGLVKNHLAKEIQLLKSYSKSGNFTLEENLHLTIVFLGEVNQAKIDDIKQAMHNACIDYKPTKAMVNGFGKFKNRGELLYWRGLECSDELLSVQSKLVKILKNKGFDIEDRPFKAHITMGRRCIMNEDFSENDFEEKLQKISFEVKNIALMKSERIGGRMVYTNIFAT